MAGEHITGAIQESLLCLMGFTASGSTIVGTVPANAFESYYRTIAEKLFSYWNQYKQPPNDHLLDIIDELTESYPDDDELYRRIYYSLLETKDGINEEYVLNRAGAFVRQQAVKAAYAESVPLIQSGKLDEVEAIMLRALKSNSSGFRPGMEITDVRSIFSVLRQKFEAFPTGIHELDRRGLGPTRKELFLYLGLPKSGKSQMLVHLGKQACLASLAVLHVTLEMSEARMCARYLQSLFSVSRRKDKHQRIEFEKDEHGSFISMTDVKIPQRPSFDDSNIERKLGKELRKWDGRLRLWIKQFPTGQLTIGQLKAYLDQMEVVHNFIPDLLILDYADLMEIDPRHERECLGKIYQDVRGIGVERNIAVATASQGNRAGAKSKMLRETDVAGDWSKIATADIVLTYSQTPQERKYGIARLFVADARNEEDKFTILLSQNYALGVYHFDSVRYNARYEDALEGMAEERITPDDAPRVQRKSKKRSLA